MREAFSRITSPSLFVPGFGLGWMVGMSVSPVTQVVVSSVATLLLGVASVLAGIPAEYVVGEKGKSLAALRRGLKISPVSFMVLGLALGSALGVYTRTNDWLGASARPLSPSTQTTDTARRGVLFSLPASQCEYLEAAKLRGNLSAALLSTPDDHIKEFAKQVHDPVALETALKELICPANK